MNKPFIFGVLFFLTQKNHAAINKDTKKIEKPESVLVAVIDTGADIKHELLKGSIWTNEGETGKDALGFDKETNQIDDDGNGFVDDVHGWNFIKNNNDISDDLGHGTHVSGIIKTQFNQHKTSRTSAQSVRLMILKYYDSKSKPQDNLKNSTRAIEYANQMKAQIINYSSGGPDPSYYELRAIEQSAKQDILFVSAAGNNNSNTDFEKYYPANYPLKNIISVAATNNQGELVSFSNYGSTIDIAAPGKLIYSSLPKKQYGFMSGTSQATAYVTGLAAASLVKNSSLAPEQLISELKSLGTYNASLKGKTKSQVALILD